MAQRCICILLVEHDDRVCADDIAFALTGQNHGKQFQERRKTVAKMRTLGSYYRNLEMALGEGVTLALGINIAENT